MFDALYVFSIQIIRATHRHQPFQAVATGSAITSTIEAVTCCREVRHPFEAYLIVSHINRQSCNTNNNKYYYATLLPRRPHRIHRHPPLSRCHRRHRYYPTQLSIIHRTSYGNKWRG
jgi:hypothetical protein